mmetsp:Transcript_12882/g.12989  ORF Transcript_12882/g.12989 Transcript_12882/m.12989 type:complete len:111 (+) Transcript_12882:879-1211(+)
MPSHGGSIAGEFGSDSVVGQMIQPELRFRIIKRCRHVRGDDSMEGERIMHIRAHGFFHKDVQRLETPFDRRRLCSVVMNANVSKCVAWGVAITTPYNADPIPVPSTTMGI